MSFQGSSSVQESSLLKIKRLHPEARIPVRATPGSSCFDLHAVSSGTLQPGTRGLIPSGLAMSVPAGFEIQVRSRSGLANKQGVFVLNSPGTVDSDYRGEVCVILMNLGDKPFVYNAGDRIAQIAVCPVVMTGIEVVTELDATQRDAGGFGSTGR